MNRAHLFSSIATAFFMAASVVAAEPSVTVSTLPRSFKAGETVKVQVDIVGRSYENARVELYVMDAKKVFLYTQHNIGPISEGARKSYSFPDSFVAPSTPEGNRLNVSVFLFEGDEVVDPSAAVRRFVYRCTMEGSGRLSSRAVCVYKTPAQLAIEALNEKPGPRPHP